MHIYDAFCCTFLFHLNFPESRLLGIQEDSLSVMNGIFCLMLVDVIITNLLRYTASGEDRVETVGFSAYVMYFQSVWSLTHAGQVLRTGNKKYLPQPAVTQ